VSKYQQGDVWWLRYSRKSKIRPERVSLRTTDAKAAELIRVEEEHRVALVLAGIISAKATEPAPATRFSALIRHVIDRKRGLGRAPETVHAVKVALNNFGTFLRIDEELAAITPERVEQYIAHRLSLGRNVKTVRNEATILGNAFRMAIRLGWIDRNPLDRVDLPKRERRPPRYLTREQYCALMKAIDDETFRDLVEFYLVTGMRRAEGTALRVSEHVDTEARVLRIPQSKQHDFREIPMGSDLVEIVRRLMLRAKGSERLVPFDPDTLTTKFREYVRKAGLPKTYTFHVLRHTCATWRANNGTPWNVLRAFMGHRDPESTKQYCHVYESRDTMLASRLQLPVWN
jgi:site-specific recombinase XerD